MRVVLLGGAPHSWASFGPFRTPPLYHERFRRSGGHALRTNEAQSDFLGERTCTAATRQPSDASMPLAMAHAIAPRDTPNCVKHEMKKSSKTWANVRRTDRLASANGAALPVSSFFPIRSSASQPSFSSHFRTEPLPCQQPHPSGASQPSFSSHSRTQPFPVSSPCPFHASHHRGATYEAPPTVAKRTSLGGQSKCDGR